MFARFFIRNPGSSDILKFNLNSNFQDYTKITKMAVLFREVVQAKYVASRTTCSYCFCWALTLLTIFLPFFLAFSTNNFFVSR